MTYVSKLTSVIFRRNYYYYYLQLFNVCVAFIHSAVNVFVVF